MDTLIQGSPVGTAKAKKRRRTIRERRDIVEETLEFIEAWVDLYRTLQRMASSELGEEFLILVHMNPSHNCPRKSDGTMGYTPISKTL